MEFLNYQFGWIELIGFCGALLILFGFYRTSIGQWETDSFWYELDNLVGSILLTAYHILTKTYVVLILNVLWAIVAFRGITAYIERKNIKKINNRPKKKSKR